MPVGSTTASPNDLYLSIATLSLQTPQIIASFFDRSSAWHKRLKRETGYLFLFTAAKTQPKLEAVRRFLRTAEQRQLSFCPTVKAAICNL